MTITAEEIRELVAKAETMADLDTLKNDIPLTEQGVDSLDLANILLLIEEKYDIKIPDEDLNKVTTINQILDYIKMKKPLQ